MQMGSSCSLSRRDGFACRSNRRTDNDGEAQARQEPKQFALQMFLDHPVVFNAASDMLSYTTLSSPSEFEGDGRGRRGANRRRDAGRLQARRRAAIRSGAAGPVLSGRLVRGRGRTPRCRQARRAAQNHGGHRGRGRSRHHHPRGRACGAVVLVDHRPTEGRRLCQVAPREELAEVFSWHNSEAPRLLCGTQMRKTSIRWSRSSVPDSGLCSTTRSIPAFGVSRSRKCRPIGLERILARARPGPCGPM